MAHKTWMFLIPFLLFGSIAVLARPAAADSQAQVQYQTPTADPDGRVIYRVQEGDTCLRIQLLTGVTVEMLRELNKLDQNCTINPGQELLLSVIVPTPAPTPDPNNTPTPPLPTPTSILGNGEICVILYNDVNGNAVNEDGEALLAGGAVSITNRIGTVSQTGSTTDTAGAPMCSEVPEGEYNISLGVPEGYNGTTLLTQVLSVKAGETAILEFGAQASGQDAPSSPNEPETEGGENNLLLAILGGVFIFMGIGLGGYIVFTRGK